MSYAYYMENCPQKDNFKIASEEVLQHLHDQYGFGLWMVTRTQGRDWVVLTAEDHGYEVQAGDVFRWADSFCSRMVRGEGPRIAPNSVEVPAYAEAPIGRQVPIGAYVGIPLKKSDGELFGTLCAIDPEPKSEKIIDELKNIELMARLLEVILECECKANEEFRRAERAEAQAMKDHMTSLFNRRGWDQLLAAEEQRCKAFAHPATILSIDLDELKLVNDTQGHESGDSLIKQTAQVLEDNVRNRDIVARVGGDEFLILAVECKAHGSSTMAERVAGKLASDGIQASIGFAQRNARGSLLEATQEADDAMYADKRSRQNASSTVRS